MDEEAVDRMYEAIMNIVDGQEYDSIMIVLGALHNSFALMHTLDEDKLRALYNMMANSAVSMAAMEHEGNAEFQTEEDPSQERKRKKARKKTGNEPGPFGSH